MTRDQEPSGAMREQPWPAAELERLTDDEIARVFVAACSVRDSGLSEQRKRAVMTKLSAAVAASPSVDELSDELYEQIAYLRKMIEELAASVGPPVFGLATELHWEDRWDDEVDGWALRIPNSDQYAALKAHDEQAVWLSWASRGERVDELIDFASEVMTPEYAAKLSAQPGSSLQRLIEKLDAHKGGA